MAKLRQLAQIVPVVDRRRPEASVFRAYMEQIKRVEDMTAAEWLQDQLYRDDMGCPHWLPKATWLAYLREQALIAANKLYEGVMNAA